MRITELGTWGGRVVELMLCLSFAMIIVLGKCTVSYKLVQVWPWEHLKMNSLRECESILESVMHSGS
jgi:hypothetical protein